MISQLQSILFKNWIPKLTCLIIAIGLWFWVNIQQTGVQNFEVPVEYINKPENMVVMDDSTRNVTVELQGPKTSLYQTSTSDIIATLDLTGQSEGSKIFWSSEVNVDYPRRLQINSINPQKIRVNLARRSQKVMPVNPRVASEPAGSLLYKLTVEPETAAIYGPTETVESLDSLEFSPVDLSNQEVGNQTYTIRARLPNEVSLSYPSQNSFRVTAHVYEKEITRLLENVPVEVENVPTGMSSSVSPSTVNLKIVGPKRKVESLSPEDIVVTVNAPEKGSDKAIRFANVELPDEISMAQDTELSPFTVKLEPL